MPQNLNYNEKDFSNNQQVISDLIVSGSDLIEKYLVNSQKTSDKFFNKVQFGAEIGWWLESCKKNVIENLATDAYTSWSSISQIVKEREESKFIRNISLQAASSITNIEAEQDQTGEAIKNIGHLCLEQLSSLYDKSLNFKDLKEKLQNIRDELQADQISFIKDYWTIWRAKKWSEEVADYLQTSEIHIDWCDDVIASTKELDFKMQMHSECYSDHLNALLNNILNVLNFLAIKSLGLKKQDISDKESLDAYEKLLNLSEELLLDLQQDFINYLLFLDLKGCNEYIAGLKVWMQKEIDCNQEDCMVGNLQSEKVSVEDLNLLDLTTLNEIQLQSSVVCVAMSLGLNILNNQKHLFADLEQLIGDLYVEKNINEICQLIEDELCELSNNASDSESSSTEEQYQKLIGLRDIVEIDQEMLSPVIGQDWQDWLKLDLDEPNNSSDEEKIWADSKINDVLGMIHNYFNSVIDLLKQNIKQIDSPDKLSSFVRFIEKSAIDSWRSNMLENLELDAKEIELPEELNVLAASSIDDFVFVLSETFKVSNIKQKNINNPY